VIITHRGHHGNQKENTLEAFEAALKAGADAIECDLRLTLDKKVVVNHDKHIKLNGSRIKISKTRLKDLKSISKDVIPSVIEESLSTMSGEKDPSARRFAPSVGMTGELLTIDGLFDYINQRRVPFFLEIKNKSPILVEEIAKRIREKKLWSQVHIMGFSLFIKNALLAQTQHERLRVLPILNFPLYSYIRKPKKSYGVFVGWIDEWYGSGLLFRKLISTKRLTKLKNFYEDKGFKVMAGVINNKTGFEYFKKAGIEDIVTDNIKEAVKYFNKNSKFESRNSKQIQMTKIQNSKHFNI